jgi:hypothetical protein
MLQAVNSAFELFVDDDRYAVPTLHLVPGEDDMAALATARRILAESEHHLGVEICLHGARVTGLGSFAVRSQPPGGRTRRDTDVEQPSDEVSAA